MSGMEVINEVEEGVEDSLDGGGGLNEECEGDVDESLGAAAAAPPVVEMEGKPRGTGLGLKKKRGGKKAQSVDQFKADDDFDEKMWTDGWTSVLRDLEQCAKMYFPGVEGKEHKVKRRSELEKYHEASVQLVGTRMLTEQAPGIVQKVFEDLDCERVAREEDDEAFVAMLDELEKASMAEIEKVSEGDDFKDAISKDEEYVACLEVLNVYQKMGRSNKHDDDNEVKPDVFVKSEDAGPSTSYAKGLEDLGVNEGIKEEEC